MILLCSLYFFTTSSILLKRRNFRMQINVDNTESIKKKNYQLIADASSSIGFDKIPDAVKKLFEKTTLPELHSAFFVTFSKATRVAEPKIFGTEEKNETYIVDFFLSPISKPVVIENIFYDFDKATLRPESKEALDEMIKMLNDNPNVTIELGAHTDRKGSDQYNERLAQRRSQSVVDYLIAGGIAEERLEAKGYGESVPKVINKKMAKNYDFLNEGDVLTEEFVLKMTPEQQEIADQINRRTEFKVLRTNYNLF